MVKPEDLRSYRWFGRESMRTFNHRSRMAQLGLDASDYRGKPVIAILNTWSDINPCHMHFKQRVEEVKRGVLALVRSGDMIELDIPARRLQLLVSDEELARRREAWKAPPPRYSRGYGAIFSEHVTQANEGCDFAVLARRDPVPEPDIY